MAEKSDRTDPIAKREALLAEISASRDDVLKSELEPPPVEPTVEAAPEPESPIPPDEDHAAEPVEPEVVEPEPAEAAPEPAVQPDDLMVEVQVDGERRMVRQSEIIEAGRRTYQKDSAADHRLQEAAAVLRRVQEYEQSVLAKQPAPAEAPPADEPDEPYVELVKAIQFGDPADAGKTLKSFIKSRQPGSPSGDPAQIAERVVRQALDEREWNDARATFDKEYQDIKADPVVAQIAAPFLVTQVTLALQTAQQQGVNRPPYLAILRDAGNKVRAKFGGGGDSGQAKATQNGPTVNVDPSKTALKRTMPQPPAARGVQRPLGDSVPQDAEKVIAVARQKSIDEIIASRARRME